MLITSMTIIKIVKDLFHMPRSIMGEPFKKSLRYIKNLIPEIKIIKFTTGTKVFDWVIPEEWNIKDAFIKEPSGKKILDFKKNLLSIVYYSHPIRKWISRKELIKKIHIDEKLSGAVPYVTSYYKKVWGFCMSRNQLKKLNKKKYFVCINSTFKKGFLEIGEYFKKGKKKKEIFFSTYLCHPSMANDNLSSVAVQTELIRYLKRNYPKNNYSYRFVFIPETIGSISYIYKNRKILKNNMLMGFALSCLGDNKEFGIINSRKDNSISDLALNSALIGKKNVNNFSYLNRGSDERQYCYPGVDLPVSGFCRSKFHTFKEYHTDKDNLSYISENGLKNSFNILKCIIDALENKNFYPKNKYFCEPNLGKRGLVSTIGKKYFKKNKTLKNFLVYSDGKKNLFEISTKINVNLDETNKICKMLTNNKLI